MRFNRCSLRFSGFEKIFLKHIPLGITGLVIVLAFLAFITAIVIFFAHNPFRSLWLFGLIAFLMLLASRD